MASTVGSIGLELYANVAQMAGDLRKAEGEIHKFAAATGTSLRQLTNFAATFAQGLAGIGLAIGGAGLAVLAKQAVAAADDIGDLADRLGLTTDTLQAFQYAARDVGASVETIATGIGRLNKTLGEAAAGSDEAIKQFQKMGVAFAEGGQLRTTEAVIRDIADRIQRAGSVAEANAIAFQAFGKGSAALVPIFRDGSKGIDELIAKLEEMGVIVSGRILGATNDLQKQFNEMAASINVALMKAVVALGPQIISLAQGLTTAARAVGAFFDRFAERLERVKRDWQPLLDFFATLYDLFVRLQGQVQRFTYKGNLVETPALSPETRAQIAAAFAPPAVTDTKITPVDRTKEIKQARDAEFQALMDRLEFEQKATDAKWKAVEDEKEIARLLAKNEREEAYRVLTEKLEFEQTATDAKWKAVDEHRAAEKKLTEVTTDAAYARLTAQLEWDEKLQQARKEQMEERNRLTKEHLQKESDAYAQMIRPVIGIFDSIERAFSTSVTGIIQGTTTLEKAFAQLGDSMLLALVEQGVKQGITALQDAMKDFLASRAFKDFVSMALKWVGGALGPTGGGAPSVTVAPVQNIDYNFSGAGFPMATGGIVQSPTFATIGEAGPEAVIPLDRWDEFGGSAVTVNIIDQRQRGAIETRESTNAAGQPTVDVLITDVVNAGLRAGAYDRTLNANFGMSRRGAAR